MVKIKIKIDGMSCEKCSGKVHDALSAVEGVQSVEVNLSKGMATVVTDSEISDEVLAMAVLDCGFKAKVKHGLF